jgi:uncharacterized protein GlcG (DUF336 family)
MRKRLTLESLDDRIAPALLAGQFAPLVPPQPGPVQDVVLQADEVKTLLDRAAAASSSDDAIVAVVDRGGHLLGVRVEGNVSPLITGNSASLVFAVDGALAEARTAAFFANDTAPLTSRTVQFISQTTITQRMVQSNPNIADINSTVYGPGLVAPVGLGGHFPPGIPYTPPVDLFGIELTNRDSLIEPVAGQTKASGNVVTLPNRFNVPDQFIPSDIPASERLVAPESYGLLSGLMPLAQARGIGTLPGGIPIFKDGVLVGGIGVFFPGTTGFATEENSSLSATFDPTRPDRSLEAEYVAYAALGGSAQANFRVGTLGGVAPLPGFDLPFGRIDLAGVTLDLYGPGGQQGPSNLMKYAATSIRPGDATSGTNIAVDTMGDTLATGAPVPDGWLVTPHDGVNLSAADVIRIVAQGINTANQTRAQIRLPVGETARMVFAVADSQGNVLGLYRMPDATVFSIDVAVAKARNTAYYDDPAQLQTADQVPGLPPGVSMTNRTFRYLAQPRFPEGIDFNPPGPFSILNDPGTNPVNGLNSGPPQPGSAFQSVFGFAAFHPDTNFRAPTIPANQNGVVFFPGSSAVYKDGAAGRFIVGGFGVSGDGVDQDDVVTSGGIGGFDPPDVLRADQFFVAGVRLPYQKFSRNPFDT